MSNSINHHTIKQRYQRAEQLLPWHLLARLNNLSIEPHWLDDSRFWFKRELPFDNGKKMAEYLLVDCNALTIEPMPQQALPQSLVSAPLVSNEGLLPVRSPDGRREVIYRQHNLVLRNLETQQEQPLTQDGERDFAYGAYADHMRACYLNCPLPLNVAWSPDGRYLAVQRIDERQVRTVPMQQCVPAGDERWPVDHAFKLSVPGDTHVTLASLCIIDTDSGDIHSSDRPPMPASGGGFAEYYAMHWSADNKVYHPEWSRDAQVLRLIEVDPVTKSSRVVIEEKNTSHGLLQLGPLPFAELIFRILAERNEVIWYSHRSGWGHLYRYDLHSGEVKNAIMVGDYSVTALHHVDTEHSQLIFTAAGRESNRNPYYEHVYRVNLDGSDLQLLTPQACQHDIVGPHVINEVLCHAPDIHGVSPNGDMFIDTQSSLDQAPTTVLRSTVDGRKLLTLSQCEPAALSDTPYRAPQSFTTKATDGVTDLWGVMYQPSDFDERQSYPVILVVYGGPQVVITPKRFAECELYLGKTARTLAELGFVVVALDPRGTPYRSKAFHEAVFGKLQNGGGIEDQIAALKQLGERFAWLDLDRVGITGYSNGGFVSARAMLTHPEFFKVGVACAGCHDIRGYTAAWGENFQGLVKNSDYDGVANGDLAANLQGKLLLVHGDMDGNVHIAHTLQLFDAFIKHNKDADLLVLPNRDHSFSQDPYFIRRLWDYFVEHLLEIKPPTNYCISKP